MLSAILHHVSLRASSKEEERSRARADTLVASDRMEEATGWNICMKTLALHRLDKKAENRPRSVRCGKFYHFKFLMFSHVLSVEWVGNFHFQWLGGTRMIIFRRRTLKRPFCSFLCWFGKLNVGICSFQHCETQNRNENLIDSFGQRQKTRIDAEMTKRFDWWF